jgi:hypothetical protein
VYSKKISLSLCLCVCLCLNSTLMSKTWFETNFRFTSIDIRRKYRLRLDDLCVLLDEAQR